MRILFLRHKGLDYVGAPGTYHDFEQTVGKIAECKWAGKEWPLHRPNEPMDATVKRVMPDADWVIDTDEGFKAPRDKDYQVGHFTSDLHGKSICGVHTPQGLLALMNRSNYDALFMKYKYVYGANCNPDIFLTDMKVQSRFLPWSIDPEKYRPNGERRVDVAFLGAYGSVYPLRNDLWYGLNPFCRRHNLKLLLKQSPGGSSFKRYIPNLIDEGHVVGSRYREALRSTRILIFGGSRFRYPVQKYFEGMASGCLVMANTPGAAEDLHFKDGYNFVDINVNNWKDKLLYYAQHRDEAEQISEQGRKTIEKYHTHDIRAQQFIQMLGD